MPPSDDKEKVENEENEKNDVSDTKSNMSDKSDKSDKSKDTPKKGKAGKKGEDRMDPARFQDGGVSFKAKIIGIEDVPEARGDKMCQDAMQKLKGMVKTAKAHKPKITVNVSLEGLKLIDEISQAVIHHHAVHKISFISRDVTDARAFGYIYGLGEGKHQFFGIKTEKPAEGLVLTLRDLFQVVFEMKKQEVEAAKAKKQQKDEDKPKDSDKSEKPTTQDGDGATAQNAKVEEKAKMQESSSEANLLDLQNQLQNLEGTFEAVDAFSATAAGSAASAAAAPQFPVSFDQPGGNQRDPFNTQPTLAPPPNLGTQQQQQKPPIQQQQQSLFPASGQADPFNTDAFGQNQYNQGAFPPQAAPQVAQQSAQQPASFASFPPPTQQQPEAALAQPVSAGAADPFKDDPFFTSSDPQPQPAGDRYAVFSNVDTQATYGANAYVQPTPPADPMGMFSTLQPLPASQLTAAQPMQAPPSPKLGNQNSASSAFKELDKLTEFQPASMYIDRSQFFKPKAVAQPTLSEIAPSQPPNGAPAVPVRQMPAANPFGAQGQNMMAPQNPYQQMPMQVGQQMPMQIGQQMPVQMSQQMPVQLGQQMPMQMGQQMPMQMGQQMPMQMGQQMNQQNANPFGNNWSQ